MDRVGRWYRVRSQQRSGEGSLAPSLPQFSIGEIVSVTGVVGEWTVQRTRAGEIFIKAPLHLDNGSSVQCVWWQARNAPQPRQRVRVRGEIRLYEGSIELHVRETTRLLGEAPATNEQRILRFYIACLEAEEMREVEFPLTEAGRQFALLCSGQEQILTGEATWLDLPDEPELSQWLGRRLMAGRSEQVLAGYPVIVGDRSQGGSSIKVVSPLFCVPVQIERSPTGTFRVLPESSLPELNVFSLELLGMSREERVGFVEAVEELEEIRAASSARALMEVWLNLLKDEGLIPAAFSLTPEHLGPLQEGICNACILYTAERGPTIRNLIADLEELLALPPDRLAQGPLGVLLGKETAPTPPPAEPQPAIIPTNLAQDRAITSALSVPLTVVTGPPGTGKSQLIVNTIASAVARGEKVCFASKNNQAVDVIFERLAAVTTEAVPIRAGTTKYRGNIALAIQRALARPRKQPDLGSAITAWRLVEKDLYPAYRALRQREEIEEQLRKEEAQYEEMLRSAPVGASALNDPRAAASAAQDVLANIPVASRPRPFWPWSRRKWEHARQVLAEAWNRLSEAVGPVVDMPRGPDQATAEECLRLAKIALAISEQGLRVEAVRKQLASLPDIWALHDQVMEVASRRHDAALKVFESSWRKLLGDALPERRAAAAAFADALAKLAERGRSSVQKVLDLIPDVLEVFPVWGVTNLSARTNFPLKAGLFDLVIIDEASQCDIPSAIPLLYRGKRALIIGDPKQLIHITSLKAVTEENIARRFALTPKELLEFSYRNRSLFSLASSRVGEEPLFLDQHFRSHPAIITFSNDHFYGSRLTILTDVSEPLPGPVVRWVHVPGKFSRGPRGRSVVNQPEAEAVVRELQALRKEYISRGFSVGVVTPYRAHAEAIQDLVLRHLPELSEALIVDTAHRFQGDERDIIIFSPVVSSEMPDYHVTFASNQHLVNVAITRARRKLIVVGDREACLTTSGVLRDLAQYIADLEAGSFRSPLERRLFDALVAAGIDARTGMTAEGYQLDLAILDGKVRIDIECDGAAFHRDARADALRDERLKRAGWQVVRLSGRDIQRDLDGCVRRIKQLLGQ